MAQTDPEKTRKWEVSALHRLSQPHPTSLLPTCTGTGAQEGHEAESAQNEADESPFGMT